MADIIAMFSRWKNSGLSEMLSRVSFSLNESASSSRERIRCSAIDDFQRIMRMLPRIKAVLEDAEDREIPDRSVKLRLSEFRLLAYDIDDVIDEYEYELLRAQMEGRGTEEAYRHSKHRRVYDDHHDGDERGEGHNMLASSSSQVPAIFDSMAEKLKKILERFDEIEKDRKALRLREEDGVRRFAAPHRSQPTSSLVNESIIFGREDDKEKIMKQLLSDTESSNNITCNNKITVIPIVGMGGVGKSTLAQLIYNDPKIRHHFDLRAWIHVPEDADLVKLTREIYRSITKKPCGEDARFDHLQDSIKKELVKFKRIFLVLDDVWNEQQSLWESLQLPFHNAGLVNILMTARSKRVADVMRTTECFCLDFLSEEAGWRLFQECTLCDDDKLMEIGRKIVEKCGGLPLAIKILGSHLRFERDEDKWMSIFESELWDLGPGKNEILPALRLSYQRMPIHLKPCFRYCSMFSKKRIPDMNHLVWLWMAHGYIQPKTTGKTMEETGREYLDELLERSLLQKEFNGHFKMHDLIFDLLVSISDEEFITMKLEDGKQNKVILNNARHLVVNDHRKPDGAQEDNLVYHFLSRHVALRSIFYYCPNTIDNFQLSVPIRLRTLHISFENCDSTMLKFLGSISSLKHLRSLYLGIKVLGHNHLEECDWVSLFNLLLNIYNLQVLDLSDCTFKEFAGSINKLINLRHLILPRPSSLPCGISKLTDLQTLKCVTVKDGGLSVIEGLASLTGSCCINNLCNATNVEDVKKANINKKRHIRRLCLNWSTYNLTDLFDVDIRFEGHNISKEPSSELAEAILVAFRPHSRLKKLELYDYPGIQFPLWLGDPVYSELRHIKLYRCNEWDGSCGVLDRILPYLQSIFICRCAKLKKINLVQSSSLRSLFVYECRELSTLHGISNLCMLKELDIYECRKLTTITGLQDLRSLERLSLTNCFKLQLSLDEQFSIIPGVVTVADCPRLTEWCQRYGFEFYNSSNHFPSCNYHFFY